MSDRDDQSRCQGNHPSQAEILSRREASSYLGVSDRTFDRIQKEDTIPFVMVGKRRKYLLRDLDAFLMSHRSV